MATAETPQAINDLIAKGSFRQNPIIERMNVYIVYPMIVISIVAIGSMLSANSVLLNLLPFWIIALFIMSANAITIPMACWGISWIVFGVQMLSIVIKAEGGD